MPLRNDGEVLHASTRSLILPTVIGAVFLGVGVLVVRAVNLRDEGWFLWIWCTFWFLGSGAVFLSSLWGLLISRPRFARLGEDGLQLYGPRAPVVPWSQILEARLAPKKFIQTDGTITHVFRHPLILRLRDRSGFPTGWRGKAFPMSPLPDGTLEWMVPLDGCPCDEHTFLAKLHARLHPERAPSLAASPEPILPVLGVHRLDRPHKPSLIAPVFSCLFLAVGLFITAKGVVAHHKSAACLVWPVVTGTITHSTLTRDSDSPSLSVRYTYEVAGNAYTGTRVAFASDSGDYPAWAERFPREAKVDVRYNPADPTEAVLLPGNQKPARFLIGFGLVFAAAGAWPIWSYFRDRRRLETWLQQNPGEPR